MDTITKRRRHSETSEDVTACTVAPVNDKLRPELGDDPLTHRSELDSLIASFYHWRALFEPEFAPSRLRSPAIAVDPSVDAHESCQVYRDIIQRVEYSTSSPPCDFEEFKDIMRTLGNPQDFWASIHVTGTNGKGTVCHKCADHLAGYNVHPIGLFTSPHIHTIRERFVVDGVMISCLDLISLIRAIEETLNRRFRFFQLCTLVAFLWFTIRRCRACVVEVGIGGSLDPTNVLSRPLCSIITSISRDHTDLLGDTEALIAQNKAAVIKAGGHAIIGPNISREAMEVICARIATVGSQKTIIDVSNECECLVERINGMIARDAVRIFVNAKLRQFELELPLSPVVPKGRLQHLRPNVLVDGGHNEMAMAAAAMYMKKRAQKIYLGIAMSKKRGLLVCNPLIKALGNQLAKVRYVQYDHPFRRPVARLIEDLSDTEVLLAKWMTDADVADTPANYVDAVVPELMSQADDQGGAVLFTGTFYFVGSVTRAVRARGSFFTKHTFC